VTRATPSNSQTCLFIACLEASLCPLPYKVVNDGRFVAGGLFFSFLFSLFLEKVLSFLLFIFTLGSIIKVLNVFNLVIELQFVIF
jgi:hypothetical protein